ncbi:MAG: hypothetical protein AAF627_09310 [Myxococcota bacterium]
MAKRRRAPAAPPSPTLDRPELAALLLALVAFATVALVALYFSREVNRIFDVPKAFVLKLGGCACLAGWLVLALTKGVRFAPTRVFALPVFALLGVVGLSTLTSIDPWMSFNGVYERQFGFQGYLACAGLFFAVSAGLRGRAGAMLGFGFLAVIGGMVGTYARVQGVGRDPLGFFQGPNNKVFSFLGNATFAGNSLALLFPLASILAVLALGHALGSRKDEDSDAPSGLRVLACCFGLFAVLVLQLLPTLTPLEDAGYRFCLVLSVGVPLGAVLFGSWGPASTRLRSAAGRRVADAVLSGALLACAMGVVLGLVHTRTRGAWVGSAAAVVGGLVLLPGLFSEDRRRLVVIRVVCWGLLFSGLVLGTIWAVKGDDLYARTVRSIPAAFDPESVKYGAGQGTRPYLWLESPRVLSRHEETMARMRRDLAHYERVLAGAELGPVPLPELGPDDAPRPGWRSAAVWLTGIGIETYRYAFMSHKSKRLEALDPMTNHDNPHNNYLYLLASLGVLGLLSYIWLLSTIVFHGARTFMDKSRRRTDRALAFGLLTSFVSYSVYSIAGFDSVACSVFLFFMLGAAAVLFVEEDDEVLRLNQFLPGSKPVATLLVVVGCALCGVTMFRARQVLRAERAFVGADAESRRLDGVERVEAAIRINPNESYYRQNLGQIYTQRASGALRQAVQLRRKGDPERSSQYEAKALELRRKAEVALMSALNHAWAPENIFISAFQLYNQFGMSADAEDALARTLEHSPHLAPIRASLAGLQLQLGKLEDAEANCSWALEVNRKNDRAHVVCARVAIQEGRFDQAEHHLKRALKFRPQDRMASQLLEELQARSSTVGR